MTAGETLEMLYNERGQRARKLHESGKKVVGHLCSFVPDEIFTALDMIPFRIQGSQSEPIDQADAYIEPMACPFARSCFNLALKGQYDFLDGFVAPHSCDTIERMFHIWHHQKPCSYNHLLNVPHMLGPGSTAFFKDQLAYFIKTLEAWSGRKLEQEKLREAVTLYNRRRALLRELYTLRKTSPPQVSGEEVTKAVVAGMGIPAREHVDLIEQYIAEIKARPAPEEKGFARVFLWGCELDDTAFISLVEESGASVVMDDLCTGSRFFWDDCPETPDPLDGIADRYLKIKCPRTNIPQQATREAELENRYGHIRQFIEAWEADAAIFYIIRYCDTSELEGPDLREYLNSMNIPVLMIEDDYSISTIGQLRTRVQAFLEMLD